MYPEAAMADDRIADPPRVLVVDDEAVVRDIVERALSLNGYWVQSADCAQAAQRILHGALFDAIVLDICMPGMDGCGLFRWMREHAPAQASKVVFLTGSSLTGALEGFLDGTARPVMQKPFDVDDFLNTIQAVAGR